jgi:hypothetical protein
MLEGGGFPGHKRKNLGRRRIHELLANHCQRGHFHHRVAVPQADELGTLSRNSTTWPLESSKCSATSTRTVQELQQEVAERRRITAQRLHSGSTVREKSIASRRQTGNSIWTPTHRLQEGYRILESEPGDRRVREVFWAGAACLTGTRWSASGKALHALVVGGEVPEGGYGTLHQSGSSGFWSP